MKITIDTKEDSPEDQVTTFVAFGPVQGDF